MYFMETSTKTAQKVNDVFETLITEIIKLNANKARANVAQPKQEKIRSAARGTNCNIIKKENQFVIINDFKL